MEPEGITKFWPRKVRMNKPDHQHRADAGDGLEGSLFHFLFDGVLSGLFFGGAC